MENANIRYMCNPSDHDVGMIMNRGGRTATSLGDRTHSEVKRCLNYKLFS